MIEYENNNEFKVDLLLILMSLNVSLDAITRVQISYLDDCIVNLSCTLPGLPLNLLVLYLSSKPDVTAVGCRVRHSVIGMAACNLYGAAGLSLLYLWYLLSLLFNVEMTVLACSIVRRILGSALIPPNLSLLFVAIDRYLLIVCNRELSLPSVSLLFASAFIYAHFIINTLQLSFGNIAGGDICGPTLKIPFIGSVVILPIIPLSIIIGLLINLRIMLHIRNHTNKGANRLRASEIAELRRSTKGLIIQTTIPLIFVLPQTVAEGIFFIDANFRAPRFFWVAINAATCIYLSINPLISIISVKQFRGATRKLCSKHTSTTIITSAFK